MNGNIVSSTYIFLAINLIAILLYYSPITIKGYWPDTIFLLFIITLTILFRQRMRTPFIKTLLIISCILNLIILPFNCISVWHGIVPIHIIPKGYHEDKNIYAYFVERGNTGLTSGCYGEIHYHKTIEWLPILEIQTKKERCSLIDYNSILNGY